MNLLGNIFFDQKNIMNIPIISGNDKSLVVLQRLSLGCILFAYLLPLAGMSEPGYSICWMYNSFRLPCPGCGLTRSVISFYHLDFQKAWFYNPFGIIISISFFMLAISGFNNKISNWLLKFKRVFRNCFVFYFILLAIAGVIRISIQIYNPELLGPYGIVNTEKILADLYPVFASTTGF